MDGNLDGNLTIAMHEPEQMQQPVTPVCIGKEGNGWKWDVLEVRNKASSQREARSKGQEAMGRLID